jgi:NH3-dependent NAD+ synthetase
MNPADIAAQLNIDNALVERVKRRWLAAEHKRRVLLSPKLEFRTIGTDFRLPRSG